MAAVRQLGEQHRVSGPDRDAVHQEPGAGRLQRLVQEVDRPGGGAAGGDDDVGGRVPDGVPQQPEVVPHRAPAEHLRPRRAQPGQQQRTERVTDPAGLREAGVEQFVAEHQQLDGGAAVDGQPVVAAGGCQAEHGRAGRRARREQLLAPVALLPARADVLPRGQRARRPVVQEGAVDAAVLAPQDGRGARRQLGPGGDLHGGAVGERAGRLPGEQAAGRTPRARAGHGPAVHRGGVEGGQVGEGGERLGEGVAEGVGEVQALRRGCPAAGPAGRLAGLRPGQLGHGAGLRRGHGRGCGRRRGCGRLGIGQGTQLCSGDCAGDCCAASAVHRSASASVRRVAASTACAPPPCWAAA